MIGNSLNGDRGLPGVLGVDFHFVSRILVPDDLLRFSGCDGEFLLRRNSHIRGEGAYKAGGVALGIQDDLQHRVFQGQVAVALLVSQVSVCITLVT